MTSLLIAEDNAGMRSLIRSLVADLFDAVTECGDGALAQAGDVEVAFADGPFEPREGGRISLRVPSVSLLNGIR